MPTELSFASGDMEAILEEIKLRAAEKLKAAADMCAEQARILCPYDANKRPTPENPDAVHLKDTIAASDAAVEIDGVLTVEVTAGDAEKGVDYAEFVELGTVHMAAEPYMGPAYEQARTELEAALGEIIP